jgi:hypothetical protein
MYALSLGVQRIDETLPKPVYALLSGLNASTVGIIALAAVQLAEKAIRDRISRILVIFGACAGLCYSALWYFPVLMIAAGVATAVWDGWGIGVVRRVKRGWRERRMRRRTADGQGREGDGAAADIEMVDGPASAGGVYQAQTPAQTPAQGSDRLRMRKPDVGAATLPQTSADVSNASEAEQPPQDHVIRVRVGAAIVVVFFGTTPPVFNSHLKAI